MKAEPESLCSIRIGELQEDRLAVWRLLFGDEFGDVVLGILHDLLRVGLGEFHQIVGIVLQHTRL